jgi:hypothetical protein
MDSARTGHLILHGSQSNSSNTLWMDFSGAPTGWSVARLFAFIRLTRNIGTVKLELLKRGLDQKLLPRTALSWFDTRATTVLNTVTHSPTTTWYQCKHVVAASQEKCIVGSWVFTKSPLAVRQLPVSTT